MKSRNDKNGLATGLTPSVSGLSTAHEHDETTRNHGQHKVKMHRPLRADGCDGRLPLRASTKHT